MDRRSKVKQKCGERGIWQRRYREHLIRDEADYCAHMDYVLFNPVNLETAVGQAEGCAHDGAEQGATTRNSDSIPRNCNAAMRPQGRAIRSVV